MDWKFFRQNVREIFGYASGQIREILANAPTVLSYELAGKWQEIKSARTFWLVCLSVILPIIIFLGALTAGPGLIGRNLAIRVAGAIAMLFFGGWGTVFALDDMEYQRTHSRTIFGAPRFAGLDETSLGAGLAAGWAYLFAVAGFFAMISPIP